jgi:hypothetical protein
VKKEYNFRGGTRGRFAIPKGAKVHRPSKLPMVHIKMEGRGPVSRAAVVPLPPKRIVNVNFDVTQEVSAALRALRDTGFFGNGRDCASVAEELLRRALLDPEIVKHWRKT